MASDSGNGGLHDEVKTVTIRTFSSHEAAQLAASNLEARGIQCWVNADDCGGMYPNLTAPGGVRLSVRASDAEAAIALLNADSNGNFKEDVHYDPFFNPIPINFNPISTNAPTAFQLSPPFSK